MRFAVLHGKTEGDGNKFSGPDLVLYNLARLYVEARRQELILPHPVGRCRSY